MLEDFEIEGLGEAAVRTAGFDPSELVDAIRLARRIVGPVRRLPASGLPGDAVLARVGDEQRIYVRGKLGPARLRWAVLHECAEALLQREDYRESDVEVVANRLAACLGAPHPAARRACRNVGPRWTQLALAFGATESSAALRYGETMGAPLALVAPASIRYRGEALAWPDEGVLRSSNVGPGLVKSKLRDDPRRRVVTSP